MGDIFSEDLYMKITFTVFFHELVLYKILEL